MKAAGEVISDSLLIAMCLKGLPHNYQPFIAVIIQKENAPSFQEFKVSLRNYEETEKSQISDDSVLKAKSVNPRASRTFTCFSCNREGHKANECWFKASASSSNKSSGKSSPVSGHNPDHWPSGPAAD